MVGFVALVSERAWTRAHVERPTLHVVVPTGLSAEQREQRVDAAVLIEEGLALGWARTDHVIRTRLITNLRFARGETLPDDDGAGDGAGTAAREDDAALLEEALRLGMQRSDLIVRRRIVSRAERMMTSDVRNAPVDDETLLAFRDAHAERFRAPARFRYVDVFLSRQRHGNGLTSVVSAMQARLEGLGPEQVEGLSDPLLYAPGERWVSGEEVARRLGGDLAAQLEAAPLGAWAGPFSSSFGAHFVWVRERREAALPSLDVARARILGAYRDARQAEAMQARMAELRAHYDITVEVREGAP